LRKPTDSLKQTENDAAARAIESAMEADAGEAPPLFYTWPRLYAAVLIYLGLFVVFLYIFTEYYQDLR
jgi:hypothetical protein